MPWLPLGHQHPHGDACCTMRMRAAGCQTLVAGGSQARVRSICRARQVEWSGAACCARCCNLCDCLAWTQRAASNMGWVAAAVAAAQGSGPGAGGGGRAGAQRHKLHWCAVSPCHTGLAAAGCEWGPPHRLRRPWNVRGTGPYRSKVGIGEGARRLMMRPADAPRLLHA